ncbi:hypothetical protein QUA54_33335 [Microcoleus sp. MOSTC5]|uniref:hypothetical protein n=1 Tax=Microcoleus sp. MOSTC5 TaxID=3055378 RepID=UPI002FCE6E7F
MLTEHLRGSKTKAEVRDKKLELYSDAVCNAIEDGISLPVFEEHWEILAGLIDIWDLMSLVTKLRPRFICLRLIPTHLRIPTPRIEVLQPLTGRAPPPVAMFVPIPHKLEMGSCARSDLAVSAY